MPPPAISTTTSRNQSRTAAKTWRAGPASTTKAAGMAASIHGHCRRQGRRCHEHADVTSAASVARERYIVSVGQQSTAGHRTASSPRARVPVRDRSLGLSQELGASTTQPPVLYCSLVSMPKKWRRSPAAAYACPRTYSEVSRSAFFTSPGASSPSRPNRRAR